MQPDPMAIMKACYGDSCDRVPDEVFDVIDASLEQIPAGDHLHHLRDTRAEVVALFMAEQGWRFCPCFALRRTEQHARVFELVHTNLANRLANKVELERVA